MGFFTNRNRVIDLTEDYRPQRKSRIKDNQEVVASSTSNTSSSQSQESSGGSFFSNFFGSSSSSSATAGDVGNVHHGNFDPETGKPLNIDSDEKRRRLAMRLKNMTDRIEELSNQIYALQQKVELLEKRNNTKKYE